MKDPHAQIPGIETKLAGFVRDYIRASSSGPAESQDEALRWVCAGLKYMLGALMDGCEEWDGWADGILPATDYLPTAVTIDSKVQVSVRGYAIWGKAASGPFWIEPFLGTVRVARDRNAVEAYEILFANAEQGLGHVFYGKRIRRADWYFPGRWAFRFKRSESKPCSPCGVLLSSIASH